MYAIRIGDRFGIGATSYDAMVNAVGEVKANLICNSMSTQPIYYYWDDGVKEADFYAVNGVKIGKITQY